MLIRSGARNWQVVRLRPEQSVRQAISEPDPDIVLSSSSSRPEAMSCVINSETVMKVW